MNPLHSSSIFFSLHHTLHSVSPHNFLFFFPPSLLSSFHLNPLDFSPLYSLSIHQPPTSRHLPSSPDSLFTPSLPPPLFFLSLHSSGPKTSPSAARLRSLRWLLPWQPCSFSSCKIMKTMCFPFRWVFWRSREIWSVHLASSFTAEEM